MKRHLPLSLLLLITPTLSLAQFSSTASAIRPVNSLPSSCNPNNGQVVFLRTDHTVYACTASNTWTLVAAGDTAVLLTRAQNQSGADLIVTLSSTDPTTFAGGISGAALQAYATGVLVWFTPNQSCSGTPTLNVDTLGAKKIYQKGGTTASACVSGARYLLRYDATLDTAAGGWEEMVGPTLYEVFRLFNASGTSVPTGGATNYYMPAVNNSTTVSQRTWPNPRAGVIRNLRVMTVSTASTTATTTCTVYVNTVASSVTITIGTNPTINTLYTSTGTATVAAGDKIALGCANSDASVASPSFNASYELWSN